MIRMERGIGKTLLKSLLLEADDSQMLKVLWYLLMTMSYASSRSYGVSNLACQNMTPVHGDFKPQNSIARVQIVPHVVKVRSEQISYLITINLVFFKVHRGQQIKISLRSVSDDSVFRGFMIQAKSGSQLVGTFIASSGVKVMNCDNTLASASHSEPSSRNNQIVLWKPPTNFRGYVRFQ